MKKLISIIANGEITDYSFLKKELETADIIICADGGAIHAMHLGVTPDYIIGDFDSIHSDILNHYKQKKEVAIIEDHDQEKTDLELAINLAETLDPKEISIYGALGRRIDHTLANLYALTKIESDVKTRIIDKTNTVELIDKPESISGEKGDIISIIPISHMKNFILTGFKWNVDQIDTKPGWFGVSNRLEKSDASVSFSEGKLLLVRVRPNDK